MKAKVENKPKGEISGLYDLRIGFSDNVPRRERIMRAIRDCFNRNEGELDKELMDKTIEAVGKNNPDYIACWDDFKETFEIKITKENTYLNPFYI